MRTLMAAALIGTASLASAAGPVTFCAPENSAVCYSFSVPETSSSTGQGDVFVQIKAPSSMSWVGVAQSSSGMMVGANMFVAYASENDSSVTLSPRLGDGNTMPHFNPGAKVTLLDGSGIKNNTMTANFKCSSCNSWQGGSMSLNSASTTWLYAYAPGEASPMRNDDASASIDYHQGFGSFQVDLTKAASGSNGSSNPFTVQTMASSSSNMTSTASSSTSAASMAHATMMKTTHGAIMGTAWGFLFPVGAIFMRLHGRSNTWAIHGSIQVLAYALSIAGMGVGIWLALFYNLLTSPHALIGLVLIAVMSSMPFAGWLQHSKYCKLKRRTWWGRGHAYLGRALIILGLVNIGLGLQLAAPYGGEPVKKGEMAYGVLGGLMGLTYLGVMGVTAIMRRRKGVAGKSDEAPAFMDSGSSRHASEPDSSVDAEKNFRQQISAASST